MNIKEKINQTLLSIATELQVINSEFFIIGASAMILSGIEIGETSDIDILTTEVNAYKLQHSLKAYMEIAPEIKENDLFHSNFARFNLPLMDIEIMGNLQIRKNGIWESVSVQEYREVSIGEIVVKIPTIEEQKRILSLFGREKDLKRLQMIERCSLDALSKKK